MWHSWSLSVPPVLAANVPGPGLQSAQMLVTHQYCFKMWRSSGHSLPL